MKYVLTLDQGTTSSRAILFDSSGEIKSMAQQEFRQIFPQPGWVEHDADEIWQTQLAVAKATLAKVDCTADDIAGIGITNQRETTVVWDRKSGEPVCNAIVWQDRRTAGYCRQIEGHTELFKQKTGLVLDPYFSGTKVRWILENVPGVRSKAESGELAFGTIDSWLLYNLTDGKVHATDATNASRTLMFNIHSGEWDKELLDILTVPEALLPEVRSSSEVYGHTSENLLGGNIAVAGIAGDQQSALFGQICTTPGMVKNTYGTGCFMMMYTGEKAIASSNNLLTTIALQLGDTIHYALEGSVFIAGAAVQWLRDEVKLIDSAAKIETLAASVEDNGGVFVVPAFAGLGAPYWDPYARGAILGLTRGSSKAHIARATLESLAHQTVDVLQAMEADSGIDITELRADGGATVNNLLMQIQADLLGTTVVRPEITETTALGAAYLAGLATGFWKDQDEIRQQWKADRRFAPIMDNNAVQAQRKKWSKAVERSRGWIEEDE